MDDDYAQRRRIQARLGGTIADKYRVTRVLGVGGMGAVYEAVNMWTERRVALKVLLGAHHHDPDLGARFLREARAATRVAHPNIVDVLDMGQDPRDGALYLVQEFLEGQDLRRLLDARGALPPREALELIAPVMGALIAAHGKGIVHRDLKPENVFLVRGAAGAVVPKLIDFGIAKMAEAERATLGALTRTGATMGTPFYMSPEQARGEKNIDAQTDVWAIGVVLYEMLAGRVPWRSDNYNALMVEILGGAIPRLEQLAPHVPIELAAAVHGALERERGGRYPDVQRFLCALLECRALDREAWAQTLRANYRPLYAPGVAPTASGRGGDAAGYAEDTATTAWERPREGATTTARTPREVVRPSARRSGVPTGWLALAVVGTGAVLGLAIALATSRPSSPRGAPGAVAPHAAAAGSVDALLQQGDALRTQGHAREAYTAYRRAYDASRRPAARAQMGLAAQALGEWVESARALHGALSAANDPWITQHRAALEAAYAATMQHVAVLDVRSVTPGAEVWVNGDRVGSVPLDEPLCLLDGTVNVEVRAPGYAPMARAVTVTTGRTQVEQFDLVPLAGSAASERPATPPAGTRPAATRPSAGSARATEPGGGGCAARCRGDIDCLLRCSTQNPAARALTHGQGAPETPSRNDVISAMRGVSGAVQGCGNGQTGVAQVAVTFASSGRVTTANVGPPFAGTPAGSCIARAVRGASVPPFASPTFTINYPFSIR